MIGNLSENLNTEYLPKKYVAVEDPKLHKIDAVNFFLQCVIFPKKLKTKNFETKKINTV